jgi:hypothetical protein
MAASLGSSLPSLTSVEVRKSLTFDPDGCLPGVQPPIPDICRGEEELCLRHLHEGFGSVPSHARLHQVQNIQVTSAQLRLEGLNRVRFGKVNLGDNERLLRVFFSTGKQNENLVGWQG